MTIGALSNVTMIINEYHDGDDNNDYDNWCSIKCEYYDDDGDNDDDDGH